MSIFRENVVKPLTRSSAWRPTRKEQIRLFPYCCICGKKGEEVHHIKSFSEYPHLELDPENLATMCRKHHFIYGHLENWRRCNKFFWATVQLLVGQYKEKA